MIGCWLYLLVSTFVALAYFGGHMGWNVELESCILSFGMHEHLPSFYMPTSGNDSQCGILKTCSARCQWGKGQHEGYCHHSKQIHNFQKVKGHWILKCFVCVFNNHAKFHLHWIKTSSKMQLQSAYVYCAAVALKWGRSNSE